jgi:hypothetical protein
MLGSSSGGRVSSDNQPQARPPAEKSFFCGRSTEKDDGIRATGVPVKERARKSSNAALADLLAEGRSFAGTIFALKTRYEEAES